MMTRARVCAVTALLLMAPGCALFVTDSGKQTPVTMTFPWSGKKTVDQDGQTAVLRVARLEASIVSRPANDAKIRRYVWEELDESGLMPPDIRQRLNDDGFRIGVAGSATPWALQSLAREAVTAQHSAEEQLSLKSMVSIQPTSIGPGFGLTQNGKSLIEVQGPLNVQHLPVDKMREILAFRDLTDLRCVFEVSVKEMNDDWVLLHLLPQIHAGPATARLNIVGAADQLPVRQNVVPLYENQFSVKLLTGEIAVIGRQESSDWTPGRLFFQPESGSSASGRLLMIRMVGVENLKGQRDLSFRPGAYAKQ